MNGLINVSSKFILEHAIFGFKPPEILSTVQDGPYEGIDLGMLTTIYAVAPFRFIVGSSSKERGE